MVDLVGIKIHPAKVRFVEAWCVKHVSPRLYYIHSDIGGSGWSIKRHKGGSDVRLQIHDPKIMTMALLSLGEYLE